MTGPPGVIEQASDYRTKRALAARFGRHGSTRWLVLGSAAALGLRLGLGFTSVTAWTAADAVAAGLSVVAVGPVEWFAHRVLFHAPDSSRLARLLNTGADHRRHHEDPLDLAWVMLHPTGARALMGAVAVVVTAWSIPVAVILDASVVGPYLTALVIGWTAIAHYEWTHLLVHSAYRPRSRHYRRLARHHRLHHYRDETRWFGVTTSLGDRLFGTLAEHGD